MEEKTLSLCYCERTPVAYVCRNGEPLPGIHNSRCFRTWNEVQEFADEMDCKAVHSSASYAINLFWEASQRSKDLYNAITGEVLCSDIGNNMFYGFLQGYIDSEYLPEEEYTEYARAFLKLRMVSEEKPLYQTYRELRKSTLRDYFEDRFINEIGWIAN